MLEVVSQASGDAIPAPEKSSTCCSFALELPRRGDL